MIKVQRRRLGKATLRHQGIYGKYAEGEDTSFVNRDEKRVNTRESYAMNQPEGVGKAYVFIQYSGSKTDIEENIPTARKMAEVSQGLELSVMGGHDGLTSDSKFNKLIGFDRPLREVACEAEQNGMNFVIEAKYPGKSHRSAAAELQQVMYPISQGIYKKGEEVRGGIVYARGNKYVFKIT